MGGKKRNTMTPKYTPAVMYSHTVSRSLNPLLFTWESSIVTTIAKTGERSSEKSKNGKTRQTSMIWLMLCASIPSCSTTVPPTMYETVVDGLGGNGLTSHPSTTPKSTRRNDCISSGDSEESRKSSMSERGLMHTRMLVAELPLASTIRTPSDTTRPLYALFVANVASAGKCVSCLAMKKEVCRTRVRSG